MLNTRLKNAVGD